MVLGGDEQYPDWPGPSSGINGNGLSNRDVPLSFHWRALDHSFLADFPLPRTTSRAIRAALPPLILHTITAAACGHLTTSYSRRKAFYADQKRYRGTAYGFAGVIGAVDLLVSEGLLGTTVAPARSRGGWQSVFWPTDALLGLAAPLVAVDPLETIRLKVDGQLVDYKDTNELRRMRAEMRRINEMLQSLALDIIAPGCERDGQVRRIGGERIHLARCVLHRIFVESFGFHGRLYHGWFEEIRKELRPFITIDGERTVEEDHPQFHARLSYGVTGCHLAGDAYAIAECDRDCGKVAFQCLLNARNRPEAVGAVAGHIADREAKAAGEVAPVVAPGRRRPESVIGRRHVQQAARILKAMTRKHKPIEDMFFKGLGLALQRLDSDMCVRTLLDLERQGIPALPIHDSYIVPQRHQGQLVEAMNRQFNATLATNRNFHLRSAV